MLHQRDGLAVTPTKLRDRLAAMETALDAFDGAFLTLPTATAGVMKPTALSAATIASELEPIYAIAPTKFKYNFAVVTAAHDLDPFDDWSVVYANVGNMAKAAKDAGLVGLVIDNESLGGLRVNYPFDLKYPAKTLDQYRAQTQLVGKSLMQAVVTSFPDAVVVVMRGPAGAEPKSPGTLVNREADTAQLLGPYFAGFVEGNGPRTLVVDGGTDYGLRTSEQFAASADWRKNALPSADVGSAFMSASIRGAWPDAVRVSFGINEIDGAHGNLLPNDPTLYANSVLQAMKSADMFAWASFTLTDLTKAAAADPFPTAARKARAVLAAPATAHLAPQGSGTGTGLMAQYFSNIDETELAQTVVDPYLDNVWTGTGPFNTILSGQNDNFSVIWSGYIEAPVTGTYTIFGTTDDGMQIMIDGKMVVDAFYFQGPTEHAGTIDLVAGKRYPIKIRYFEGGGATEAHLAWQPPNNDKGIIPQAWLYPSN